MSNLNNNSILEYFEKFINTSRFSITIIITIILIILYEMIFFNQVASSGDSVAREPINQWSREYRSEHDEIPAWNSNLFSGMPSLGSYVITNYGPINTAILTMFNKGITYGLLFFIAGLGVYLLLKRLKLSEIPALFGAITYAITPYQIGLINAGHGNKIIAISYFPWIFLAIYNLFYNRNMFGILTLALMSALQLWSNHPQMVYYSWMIIVFFWSWKYLSNKVGVDENKNIGRTSFFILLGLFLSLVVVADPYYSVFEFQQYSDRGAASVLDKTTQTQTGVKWKYATQWSFEPYELISFIYPYFYGLQNFPSRNVKSIAYWGGMQFTQSTHYFGIIVILMALIGVLIKKPDSFQLYLWTTSLLILFVGFGSHLSILFSPLFYWAPFFSKFRVPSMIYGFLPFTFGILGAIGLNNLMDFIKKGEISNLINKKISVAFFSIIFLTLIYFLFGNTIVSFVKSGETAQYSQAARLIRIELFEKGMILALFLLISSFVAIWMAIKKRISTTALGIIIITLLVADLYIVNDDFMNLARKKDIGKQFQSNKITEYLLKDKANFRIFPADDFSSNWYGYFGLSSIGGYRPVKLRNYQDLIDVKGFSNPQVLNMLNVKYVLTQKKINNSDFKLIENVKGVYENLNVLPKAWIIGKIKNVSTQKESLMETLLNKFDPSTSAIVFNYQGDPIPENAVGDVVINSKNENEIHLTSKSKTGGLLVLSEIYFKPGWSAFINGKEVPIYQTNHVLRSINIPIGETNIIFSYNRDHLNKITYLSRSSLIIIIFGLGLLFWKENKIENYFSRKFLK
ncbi:MAG TPA: hypothetical protein EYQ68_00365 [Cytophagales bacterium]|nr:hypothetical protein [Cytophagales bacterium]